VAHCLGDYSGDDDLYPFQLKSLGCHLRHLWMRPVPVGILIPTLYIGQLTRVA